MCTRFFAWHACCGVWTPFLCLLVCLRLCLRVCLTPLHPPCTASTGLPIFRAIQNFCYTCANPIHFTFIHGLLCAGGMSRGLLGRDSPIHIRQQRGGIHSHVCNDRDATACVISCVIDYIDMCECVVVLLLPMVENVCRSCDSFLPFLCSSFVFLCLRHSHCCVVSSLSLIARV